MQSCHLDADFRNGLDYVVNPPSVTLTNPPPVVGVNSEFELYSDNT